MIQHFVKQWENRKGEVRASFAAPFAMAADVVTLGNMGDRSFTQQVFDAEKREQRNAAELEALKALAPIIAEAMKEKQ